MSKLVALAFGLLLLGPLGCRPKIGDKCETSVDCSVQGDRLCDATQPDGYCTIFNCEPDGCPPGEAQCVAFNVRLDPACGDAINATATPRFERSFCMKPCSDDSDCRAGYACLDPADKANHRNAAIIDSTRDSDLVCMVAASLPPETYVAPDGGDGGPGVCEPGDASFDVAPYDGGAGGAGGASGKGGAGGA